MEALSIIEKEPISFIMTKNVITLNPTDTLLKAKKMMKDHNIRHLPVTSEKKLLGMVSLTDVLRMEFGEVYGPDETAMDGPIVEMLTVGQIMRSPVKTVEEHQTIYEVAELLIQEEYHALPVQKEERLCGIVTTTDVIRCLVDKIKS